MELYREVGAIEVVALSQTRVWVVRLEGVGKGRMVVVGAPLVEVIRQVVSARIRGGILKVDYYVL
jgi:hypothetical protein